MPRATWVLRGTFLLAWAGGSLGLLMQTLALIGAGWPPAGVLLLWSGALAGGLVIAARLTVPEQTPARAARADTLALGAIAAVAAAVLFNSAYFPFSRDDAVAIYQPTALAMWESGTLEPLIGADSLYRTYPILVPLLYTFAYQMSGWPNEPLARTLAALLALGCLPAAYLLGSAVAGRGAGRAAALLLALSPAFVRWASSGYVDLPMAFFYALAALFALRFAQTGDRLDALLAGVMTGFAALTKNAALVGVPLVAIWLVWAAWLRAGASRRARLAGAFGGLALCAIIAAPWYLRNLYGAGFLVPNTAWTDQADRSLRTLLIYVTLPDNYALSGWILLIGVGALIRRTLLDARRQRLPHPAALTVLWFSLPFFVVWWMFVSYDPRFVLLFTPIVCAAGGWWIDAALSDPRSPLANARARTAAAGAVVLLACIMVWIGVEHKRALLRDPFMSYADRLALARPAPPD